MEDAVFLKILPLDSKPCKMYHLSYHIVSTLTGASGFHVFETLSGHAGAISGSQDPVGLEDSLTTAEGKAGGTCCLVFSRILYHT